MGVYPSTYLGWPGRSEETVPQGPKMADGGRDRAPWNRTDVVRVSELVVSFQLAARCGLPGAPLAARHVAFPLAHGFERLAEMPQLRVFIRYHDLTVRRASRPARPN